jgi:protein-L-isoaspartate(D-aspartate) O-methyltransferase
MDKYLQARNNMVSNQLTPNYVVNQEILDAMRELPRHEFAGEEWREVSYYDGKIPLGEGRYMLQPEILARMIQSLQLGKNEKVLEIACGTGYATAILSRLASEVVAVESISELALKASNILPKLGLKNISVKRDELFAGASEKAPFDAILINGKVRDIPLNLIGQLREGGRLVYIEQRGAAFSKAVLSVKYGNALDKIDLFEASGESLQ